MHHEISKTSIHKNAAKSESNYLHKQVFHRLTSPFCPFDEADIRQCYRKNLALFGCKRSQIELEYPVYHVHCQVELRVTGSLQACYLLSVGHSIGKYADQLPTELGLERKGHNMGLVMDTIPIRSKRIPKMSDDKAESNTSLQKL